MTDNLQDGSKVIDFQEDGLVNKRNTKLHANLEIFWFSVLMIKETHAQRIIRSVVNNV